MEIWFHIFLDWVEVAVFVVSEQIKVGHVENTTEIQPSNSLQGKKNSPAE
jgi:hypothetical protein